MKGAVTQREPEKAPPSLLLLCSSGLLPLRLVFTKGRLGGARGTGKNPKHRLVVCPAWKARVEASFLCPFSSPHLLIVRRAPPLSSPSQSTAAAAKSLQSCPTLCDPPDGSPPGSPVPGILQARTLEWGAISFSKAWKWKVKLKSLSCLQLLATPWTAAHQAPASMGFSRQEDWMGCHCLLHHNQLQN